MIWLAELVCSNFVPAGFYKEPIVLLPELRISSNGKKLKNLQQYDTTRVFQILFKPDKETKLKKLFEICYFY